MLDARHHTPTRHPHTRPAPGTAFADRGDMWVAAGQQFSDPSTQSGISWETVIRCVPLGALALTLALGIETNPLHNCGTPIQDRFPPACRPLPVLFFDKSCVIPRGHASRISGLVLFFGAHLRGGLSQRCQREQTGDSQAVRHRGWVRWRGGDVCVGNGRDPAPARPLCCTVARHFLPQFR